MLALSAQASPRALKHVASNAGLLRSRVAPTTRPQLALREIPSDLRGHNIDRPAATLVCSVNHDALEQSLTLVVGRLKNNANQVNAVAPTDILSLKCPDGEIRGGLLRLRGEGSPWAELVRQQGGHANSLGTLSLMDTIDDAFQQVYTMGRPGFILQHVVDAHAVQAATAASKPISVVFGLVGLYLHIELGWTGHQVQEAHMRLGWRKREWPQVSLPQERGCITPVDVLAAASGPDRDSAIDEWCRSVWTACSPVNRQLIVDLLRECQIA